MYYWVRKNKDLKRYDDAITAFRQALRIDPEAAKAWNNLGTTYGGLKRYDDALTAYRLPPGAAHRSGRCQCLGQPGYFLFPVRQLDRRLANGKTLRTLDPAKAEKLFNLIVPR